MKPGTRIRMNDRCVWPKRRGATGVVVAPPAGGTYPGPIPASEVLVLLDDDPLGSRDRYPPDRGWTCVTSKISVRCVGVQPHQRRRAIDRPSTGRRGQPMNGIIRLRLRQLQLVTWCIVGLGMIAVAAATGITVLLRWIRTGDLLPVPFAVFVVAFLLVPLIARCIDDVAKEYTRRTLWDGQPINGVDQ